MIKPLFFKLYIEDEKCSYMLTFAVDISDQYVHMNI